VKLTIHFRLVPRIRMNGAKPPLLQYVFMAWCLFKHREFTYLLTFLLNMMWDAVDR